MSTGVKTEEEIQVSRFIEVPCQIYEIDDFKESLGLEEKEDSYITLDMDSIESFFPNIAPDRHEETSITMKSGDKISIMVKYKDFKEIMNGKINRA